MNLLKNVLAIGLSVLLAGPLLAKPKTVSLADLAPTPDQGEAADWVAKYLTRLHYASKPLDDVMSREILKRYLEARDPEKIAVSHLVDGMPQRMIPNEYLAMLEKASPLKRLRIAIGLAQNWPQIAARGAAADAARLPPAGGLRAAVSGSCSQATNAQVAAFRQGGRPALALDPLALAAGDDGVAQALAWADGQLHRGPVLVYASAEPAAVRAVQAQLGVARAGELVEQALSRIAVGLVERGVRQLVVAGGETSGAVVQALGIARMAIGPQIDPGVPWTAVQSPAAPGEVLHMALKSGNFGGVGFFGKAFDALATR